MDVIRGGKRQAAKVVFLSKALTINVRPGYGNRLAVRACAQALLDLTRRMVPSLTRDGKKLVPLMEWTISEMDGEGFAAFARPVRRRWQPGEPARFIIDPAAVIGQCDSKEDIPSMMEFVVAHELGHAAEFALGLRPSERRCREFAELWMDTGEAWRFWLD